MTTAISVVALLAFGACSVWDEETVESVPAPQPASEKAGVRSVDRALAELQRVLDAIDGGTRTGGRTVRDIQTVYRPLSATRSAADDGGEPRELVYIVNFGEGEGGAILGADERLAPVIAVTDTDSIGPVDFIVNKFGEIDDDYIHNDDDDEPDLGDCPYYDAADDDFYIGNSDTSFVSKLLADYIYFEPAPDPETPAHNGDGSDLGGTFWEGEVELSIPAMLKTKWNQKPEPFNSKIHYGKNDERRPAGCTTAAAAQIFAYRGLPDIGRFDLDNSACTWDALEECRTGDDLRIAGWEDEISTIYKTLADAFKMKYNYFGSDGSYAKPNDVCKYMKSAGYPSAKLHRTYDEDDDCNRWERVELYQPGDPFKVGRNKGGIDSNGQADPAGDRGGSRFLLRADRERFHWT